MRRARPTVLLGAAALALAACTSAAGETPPTWEPSPGFQANGEGPGAGASPILPLPSPGTGGGGPGAPGAPGSTAPRPSGTGTAAVDPNVVATHLTTPVGLTMMPDGTALVGERTTGRIVRVQPVPGQPVPTVRVLGGLDPSGDGGLLDLALSPTYDEDNLIYAYITTPTDNRVVDFTLHGPVTPVLTGIPRGRTGNTGRIAFGGDGDLYIGTGDAGHPTLAADPKSLAGKVLRVDTIGDPAKGNPTHASSVYTTGHHVVDGLCPLPQTPSVFEVEAGAGGRADEVNVLEAGKSYGWPTPAATAQKPVATLPAKDRAPGGCAVRGAHIWVTSLDGDALLSAPIGRTSAGLAVGTLRPVLTKKYGRLRTVVAAEDGALWLTTSNRDGHGHPVSTDERVIRYIPTAGGANSPV